MIASLSYTHSTSTSDSRTFLQPYIPGRSYSGSNWTYALNGVGTQHAIYNVFVDGNAAPFADDSFYTRYYQQRSTGNSGSSQLNGRLRATGSTFELPAGEQTLMLGVDADNNKRHSDTMMQTIDTGDGTVISSTNNPNRISDNARNAARTNLGFFGELNTPLVSSSQKVPLVESLSVQISGRNNQYYTAGQERIGSNVGQVGVVYSITRDVSLRASLSSGFQPPTADELTVNTTPNDYTYEFLTATGENVTLAPDQYLTGGNPNLKASRTQGRQVGLVLTPRWVKGLRFSVDYSKDDLKNAISSYTPQTIVESFPDRVTRDSSGKITFVDATYMNTSVLSSERIDYQLSYEHDQVFGGQLGASLSASQYYSYKSQITVGYPVIENIGNPHGNWQRDEWPGANLALNWSRGSWNYGWTMRYLGRRLIALSGNFTTQNPALSSYDQSLIAVQGGTTIGSAMLHDFVVSYQNFPKAGTAGWRKWLENTRLSVGVKNLFNREARFAQSSPTYGVLDDLTNARSVWISGTKSF